MHAADDDSVPVPHDAFRMPRGVLKWKAPYLFVLLMLGGAYGVLMLAGRLSPGLLSPSATGANEALKLPLIAQLATAFAGLAALVLVLSRAVREIDKRPYVAVAPVLAAFSGLVLAGLHVELSAFGASSALVAFGALAVALMGGALIVREDGRAQRIGWGLVLGPSAWVLIVAEVVKGQSGFEASERAYLAGLFLSTLLMGAAGVFARKLRSAVSRTNVPRVDTWDDLSEVKTSIMPATAFRPRLGERDAMQALAARAAYHWRGSSGGRMAVIAFAVALVAYLGVRGLRHADGVRGLRYGDAATQAVVAPAVAAPAGPPLVQQLSGTSGEPALAGPPHHESMAKPSLKRASGPARGAALANVHVASPATRRAAVPPSKPARASARPTSVISAPASSAGLPAWGAEVVGEFGSSKPAAPAKGKSFAAPASKPVEVSVSSQTTAKPPAIPAPSATKVVPVKAPILVAKPVEPAKPVAPPPPSKPLTMDQVLDRVEAAARAQRKKDGLQAPPKASKRDNELEELINSATKSKKK